MPAMRRARQLDQRAVGASRWPWITGDDRIQSLRGLPRSGYGPNAFALAFQPQLHDISLLGRAGYDPGAASFIGATHYAPKPMPANEYPRRSRAR